MDHKGQRKRRRDALNSLWSRGSLILVSAALSAVLLAFVFYDRPIVSDTQLISYFRSNVSTPTIH